MSGQGQAVLFKAMVELCRFLLEWRDLRKPIKLKGRR